MPLAAVAAEDQKFPHHWGFDFESIEEALMRNKKGMRLRGASTITQQVAKNLFLWSGRSYVRKGLEAYFTVLLELLWSKRRILEVYLNIAEFGDNTYGVYAAAKTLLGKSPIRTDERGGGPFGSSAAESEAAESEGSITVCDGKSALDREADGAVGKVRYIKSGPVCFIQVRLIILKSESRLISDRIPQHWV